MNGSPNAGRPGQPEVFLQHTAVFSADGEVLDSARPVLEGFLAAAIAHVQKHAPIAVA